MNNLNFSQSSLFSETDSSKNISSNFKPTDRFLNILEDIHNYIYANDGLSSQEAFEDVLILLFIKIFDENKNKNNGYLFYINSDEFELFKNGNISESFIERFNILKKQAFQYYSDILKNEDIKLKNSSIAFIVNVLQNIDLSKSSRDIKGLAFQKFVYSKQRKDRGQFFTPEQVIDLCVKIIKPKIGDKILDPACGSGGFLSQSINYIFGNNENEIKKFIKNNIFGIEINNMAAKIAKMRMILEGEEHPNITISDSLASWDIVNFELNKFYSNVIESFENYFDVIMTNPPFGSQGKIIDKSILNKYELAHRWEKRDNKYFMTNELQNGQVPDILFIERCIDFLKPGGKLAIVLPNGDLENPSMEYLRFYIKLKAKLLGIISLPFDTFIPFGTGIRASVIFLQKKNFEEIGSSDFNEYKIFFGKIDKIGYEGNKNGSTTYKLDSTGNKITNGDGTFIVDEDLKELSKSYDLFYSGDHLFKEDNKYFSLNSDEINGRFDFNYYRPEYRELNQVLKNSQAKELSQVLKIIKRKSSYFDEKESEVNYVELSDISPEYCEIINSTKMFVHELPSRASFELKEGDIITAVAGNNIGSRKHVSAIVSKEYDCCIATNGLRILKPIMEISPYYVLFYLKTEMFLQQIYRFRTGAAIPSISDDDLLRVLIYIPSKETERDIENKMMNSFKLRKEAKEIIKQIENDFCI
jgi:type I restriction enzyme M protein